MTNWREYKLGEIINLKRGHDLPSNKRTEGTIPIISSSGLTGWNNEYKCKGPGVVTGRYGTIGQVFYVEGKYWPLNTTLYVEDFKKNLPKFIYYFLKTLNFEKFNDKSTVPGINRNHLHQEIVSIPDLPTQTAIAEILSSLDDKIELNNKLNQELENLAQTLFKQWFIDFEFPNENGEPYKSSGGEMVDSELGEIPENFTISILSEQTELVRGISYSKPELVSKEEGLPFVNLKCFALNGTFRQDDLTQIMH
jgi:type I restriction enzyme S subunit